MGEEVVDEKISQHDLDGGRQDKHVVAQVTLQERPKDPHRKAHRQEDPVEKHDPPGQDREVCAEPEEGNDRDPDERDSQRQHADLAHDRKRRAEEDGKLLVVPPAEGIRKEPADREGQSKVEEGIVADDRHEQDPETIGFLAEDPDHDRGHDEDGGEAQGLVREVQDRTSEESLRQSHPVPSSSGVRSSSGAS